MTAAPGPNGIRELKQTACPRPAAPFESGRGEIERESYDLPLVPNPSLLVEG